MKTILVPTDFSEYSNNALEVAKFIARKKNAVIKLLHVIEEPYTPKFSATGDMVFEDDMHKVYILKLMEKTAKRLHKITEKLKSEKYHCESDVTVDKAYSGIISDIVNTEADLVVMGSQGSGNDFDDFFIGSTAEKVIRKSKAPVLTVKSKPGKVNFKNIIFASDFEEDIPHLFQRVVKFAEVFNSNLHFLRVNTPGKFLSSTMSKKKMDDIVSKYGANKKHKAVVYSDRSEEEGILNFANEVNADLIVLGTHGRTGFSQFFKSSIAEDVAGHSVRPVLTYNIPFEENEGVGRKDTRKDEPKKRTTTRKKTTAKSAEKTPSAKAKTTKTKTAKESSTQRTPLKKQSTTKSSTKSTRST
ncbi:MAG: universal stress protein, partial [Cytophagaceae bacterium]